MFCPVLKGLLLQPHLTACCGKHLSKEAALRIKEEQGACPLCKEEKLVTMLDKNTQRKIKEVPVFCKNRGCQWQGELAAYHQHTLSCSGAQEITIPSTSSETTTAPRELALKEDIKLRDYQEELARPGLQGKNYILISPTGTGKTLVAGFVIVHHLNKMLGEGRRGKVAFVTPTQQLTFQQKQKLHEYIQGIRVVDITGASDIPMQSLVQSDQLDVIVCTAGKLRRELMTKTVAITDFSLIVADECHHAGRPSNYSDIMEFYIRLKLAGKSAQLPQVLGMTASPGAGRGKASMISTLDHQISLCATLDATTGIIAVGTNTKDFKRLHGSPTSYLEIGDERDPRDPFVLCVNSTMETLEQFIGSDIPLLGRGSTKYVAWLQNEKEAAEDREEDERERISVLDRLNVYSLCLLTYRDFRYEDAMSVLEEIEEFQDQSSFERFLYEIHKGLLEKLSGLPKTPNPLLVKMESILLDQFTRCPNSRGIFFVQAVKHTRYATAWISSSPALSRIIRPLPSLATVVEEWRNLSSFECWRDSAGTPTTSWPPPQSLRKGWMSLSATLSSATRMYPTR